MLEKDFCEYRKLSKELLKIQENYKLFKERAYGVPSKQLTNIPGGTEITDRTSLLATKLFEIEKQIIEFNEKRMRKEKKLRKELSGVEDIIIRTVIERYYIDLKTWEEIAIGDFCDILNKDTLRVSTKRFFQKEKDKKKRKFVS